MNRLQTFIGIRFEVEGFHNYPDASKNHGELVKFLEQSHRHIFKFNCKKRVNHDNRDEEFILLRRKVKQYINKKFPVFEMHCECYDFGSMSCEMIAKIILKQFDFDSVEVSEDGENYAIVEKEKCDSIQEENNHINLLLKKLPLIKFVVGKAFSGKTYFVDHYCVKSNAIAIEVGNIIRELNKDKLRVFDARLDEQVSNILFDKIKTTDCNKIIYIIGCRQKSIIDKLLYLCKSNGYDLNYGIDYIFSSENKRRKRFEKLANEEKNKNLTFEEIEKGEISLGINELISWCIDQPNCQIINS